MRGMDFRDFTFPTELRPLDPAGVICGPAFTVEGEASPTDAHETLLAWTGLLSKAPAGSVWVSQPNDRIVAHMGELSAETLKDKGVLGCVADGFISDTKLFARDRVSVLVSGLHAARHCRPLATQVCEH